MKKLLLFLLLALAVPIASRETLHATVADNASRHEYTANGATTTFAYTFKISDRSHLAVYVAGVLKTVNVDYTVTGVGALNGGSVVFTVAPANAALVIIVRAQPFVQGSTYGPGGGFPSSRVELDYDKIWMGLQQLREIASRSLRFSPTSTYRDYFFPEPSASQCIAWNSGGTALENVDCGTGGGGGGGGTGNIKSVSGTAGHITVTGGTGPDPVIDLPTILDLTGASQEVKVRDGDGFVIHDNADLTKRGRFEASGISTGTTRTYTLPNGNGTFVLSNLGEFTGAINTDTGYRVSGLAPSGQYIRGNGTNGVFGAIQVADLPLSSDWAFTGNVDLSGAASVTGVLTAETQGLNEAFSNGKAINGANSAANAAKTGDSVANQFWCLYRDPTDGLQALACNSAGAALSTDYFRKVPAGNKSGFLNSSGVEKFTFTESTGALTNVTMDAEGSGNTITAPSWKWLPFAACQNTTASLIWDSPTSSAAAAACFGTNTTKGVADFDAAADESLHTWELLPDDFTGAIDIKVLGFAAATTGTARLGVRFDCSADGESHDLTSSNTTTFNFTPNGTTNRQASATSTGITITGCAAGELAKIQMFRDADGTSGTDDMTGDWRGIGLAYKIRRAM